MSVSPVVRYALWSGLTGCASGLLVAGSAASRGPSSVGWALLGWVLMALPGVAGGAWLVSKHGQAGSGFLVALGTCMLSRLIFGGAGAVAAVTRGPAAIGPYLAGAGVTYICLQVFEAVWFARRPHTEGRRA